MNKSGIWWLVGIVVIVLAAVIWWSTTHSNQQNVSNNSEYGVQTGSTTTSSSTPAAANNGSGNGGQNVSVESRASQNVATIVAGISGASTFKSMLSASGVSLAGKGPYTVFVPLDGGYKYLTPGTITNMTATQKKRFVQYHIVSGKTLNINTTDSGSIQALSKDMLNFTVHQNTGLVQVNSAYALHAYKGTNGIVYVITQPLVPPMQTQ